MEMGKILKLDFDYIFEDFIEVVRNNDCFMVEMLLERGVNINFDDVEVVLELVIFFDCLELIEILVVVDVGLN